MRPYVTTLLRDTQRLINGFADVGTKDDGGQSNESFIMMVMNGDVQGVSVFVTSPHMHDDALSVTSDGYDCIMLSVLLGDVELLHALLRAISEAHADMSRHSADLTKQYARAIEGANINMLMFPPCLAGRSVRAVVAAVRCPATYINTSLWSFDVARRAGTRSSAGSRQSSSRMLQGVLLCSMQS